MSKEQLVFGVHAVKSALENDNISKQCLFVVKDVSNARVKAIISDAKKANVLIEYLPRKVFDLRFDMGNHQGVVLSMSKPQANFGESDIKDLINQAGSSAFVLILDGLTDPHNLGACIRSADAFGVDMVIVPKDKSAPMTPVVKKVASGAADVVPFIQVTNLARTMSLLKDLGVWLYGACGEADASLYDIDLKGPVALAMGNEGKGLRRLSRECCDGLFKIPMFGTVSSLNVSVATGVCLAEARRQRAL